MAITTPDAVPGEVIEAAWGDAVRADLSMLDSTKLTQAQGDTRYVNTAGDTMTGPLVVTPSVTNAITANGQFVAEKFDTQHRFIGPLLLKVTAGTTTPAGTNLLFDRFGDTDVTGGFFCRFQRGGSSTVIGTITQASATTVAYNTTSDPRTKTAPMPRGISDAAARAQQLGRGAWQGSHIDPETGEVDAGETWDFLSSHDIEDVAAYAVTGERDAVDGDGNPVFQQVSYGDLVPLLFAALANALDRIDVLEAGTA